MASTRTYLLLIILLILAVYSNTFQNEFVWDDEFLIVKNPAIMSWNYAWIHFASDLYHSFSNYYRPVQMLTYMMDFSFWRLDPFGYHLTNVLLHLCVALLFFVLVRLMAEDGRVAFIAALFYAAHPAHTAAVAYIAGRADPLAALFWLLSLIFLHGHFKSGKTTSAVLLYVFSLASYAGALLSKEVSVILPAIVLLYRLFFISNEEVRRGRDRIKFHYLSWFVIITGVYVILRINALNFQSGLFMASRYPLYLRLMTSLKALGIYLGIVFLPLHLQMERNISFVSGFFESSVLLSALLCLLVIWLAVKIRRVLPKANFGLLFFIIALMPVMNIYPLSNNMAEHWLYIPLMGISIYLSWVGITVWDKRKYLRPALIFLMAGYILFFSYRTVARNTDWRDEYTIYTRTFNYNPASIKILNNLGNLYHERGDMMLAVMFHKEALAVNPHEPKTRLNLGYDYVAMGMYEDAVRQYLLSIAAKPDYAKAYFNMGNTYAEMGKMGKAAQAYRQAIRYDEFYVGARTNLGNIYFTDGAYEKAIGEYESIIRINPYLPDTYNNLGRALSGKGAHKEAITAFQKAIELAPEEAEYHLNLGAAYGNAALYPEAVQELLTAYHLHPRDAKTLINLGVAYFRLGDNDAARREWRKALLVDPLNPTAKKYLKK